MSIKEHIQSIIFFSIITLPIYGAWIALNMNNTIYEDSSIIYLVEELLIGFPLTFVWIYGIIKVVSKYKLLGTVSSDFDGFIEIIK